MIMTDDEIVKAFLLINECVQSVGDELDAMHTLMKIQKEMIDLLAKQVIDFTSHLGG